MYVVLTANAVWCAGDAAAQHWVGNTLWGGGRREEALQWWGQAADQGWAPSHLRLGEHKGVTLGGVTGGMALGGSIGCVQSLQCWHLCLHSSLH